MSAGAGAGSGASTGAGRGADAAGLAVSHLAFAYGGAHALHDVSLTVPARGVVALLGANGAGKSTTAKVIAGALTPRAGQVRLGDTDITGMPSHQVMRRGLVLVPEGRLVFPQMTIEENLQVGGHKERRPARIGELLEQNYVRFPRLRERRRQLAGSLSGGEQQMLAIARGLMAEPRLLILDEPSLGIMPKLVREIFQLIREVASQGVAVLLIEQNARASLEISDHAYVLDKGRILLNGPSRSLLADSFVQNAYLGADGAHA